MEVTRQLLTERAGKHGLARIQLTCCWAGQRLRLGTGQKAAPADWDARRGRLKKGAAYAGLVNQVLDDYQDAATAAAHAATQAGQPLDKPALRAAIAAGYAALVAARAGQVVLPAPPQPAPLGFFAQFDRWIASERTKVSVRTGRPLAKDTLWTHEAVRDELRAFAQARRQDITFAGLNQAFYDGLRNYMLGPAGRSPRTFNTHIKRLRSFLFWAEGQELPVPPRFRKVLRLAPSYVGKEALTQAELLRVAAIDFQAPATQAYLAAAFPEPAPRQGRGGRGELPSAAHAQRCQWTRDLFLLCAYTSLRHGDAQELAWHHVLAEQELIKKNLNKTSIVGLIPYLDDDVFRPVSLLEATGPWAGLPACRSCATPGCTCPMWRRWRSSRG